MMSRGFTTIEVVLVIGLLVILLSFSTPNLFNPLGTEKVNSTANEILTSVSDAQAKAINSETLGQISPSEFGIHFTSTSYTIFPGTVFNPSDQKNFTTNLDSGLSLSPNLPCPFSPNDCNNIVFSKLSGEVQNFDPSKNSLCLADNLNNKIKLSFNYLGVTNAQVNGC